MDPFTPERESPPAYTPGLSRPFPVHAEHNPYVHKPFNTVFLIDDSDSMVDIALIWWLEGHNERASWTGTAAVRVEDLVPYGGQERKEVWGVYLPHGMYTAGLVDIIGGATSASLLERLGRCQERLGRYAPAEGSHRKASSLRKEVLGPEHPDTLTSISNLAGVLVLQGKYEDAETINRQTLALREKVLRREHLDTLTSTSNLALVLGSQGKYEDAETMNRKTLAQREKVLGLEHPDTLTSMSNLALVLGSQGKYEDAETMNRKTLARREKVLGLEHPDTLMSVYCLAYLLAKQHRVNKSLIVYQRASSGYNTTLRKDHPTTKACDQHYAELCALQEQNQLGGSPSTLDSGTRTSTSKRLRLSRWCPSFSSRRRRLVEVALRVRPDVVPVSHGDVPKPSSVLP
jgi:tetratricopeptide (TPR) repeat protein